MTMQRDPSLEGITVRHSPEHEFGAILADLDTMRSTDARAPTAISLGPAQKASVAAYVKALTGQADAGPIVSFQSLPVVDGPDGVSLVWEAEPKPTEAPPVTVAPPVAETPIAPAVAIEATPAPAEAQPSGV